MARRLAQPWLVVAALSLLAGCAHHPLAGRDLERFSHPAFVSRIEDGAGPHSNVFRDDASSYKDRLKTLDPKEADRRLTLKLTQGTPEIPSISRFEVADTLRAEVVSQLARERPWSSLESPAAVARALESFLVDEVPANAPDYERLRQLSTDAVVEIVIEDYGMRSEKGRAGVTLKGHARLFTIDGAELYHRRFRSDDVAAGAEHLDPFAVAKNPGLFRARLHTMLLAIAAVVAKDLSPEDRQRAVAPAAGTDSDVAPVKKLQRTVEPAEDPL